MTINPIEPTMTVAEFAAAREVSERTVKRWLQAGEIPAAYKVGDRWAIPDDAQRMEQVTVKPAHEVVALNAAKREQGQGQAMTLLSPAPLGVLLTLEDAAAQLGTTTGGIRRLGEAGQLTVGKFGPNGSMRVYLP